jgi:HemY protein
MRRLLTFLVLAVVIGGAVGTLMARDPGYVLITYAGMSFETSLWFALLALLVGYFLLRLIIGIWVRLVRSGTGVANWQQNRRARTAAARTVRGLLLVGEGDWVGARKALSTTVGDADTPLINYVAAARAANELGDTDARDALLQQAGASMPDALLAVGLTQAEMQLSMGQYSGALATLLKAKAGAPNHVRVLRLLTQCHEQLEDWPALVVLAPELRKRAVFTADALRTSLRRWWIGYFDQLPDGDAAAVSQQLSERWSSVDKDLRGDPELIAAYAQALMKAGAADAAESTLNKALRQDWNEGLIALYGRVHTAAPERQLSTAETWLKQHPNDATLLLALGRMALAGNNSAKAREYFEESLKQRATAEIYGELGRLCLALGEWPRAAELLALALDMGSRLPPPALPDMAADVSAAARS